MWQDGQAHARMGVGDFGTFFTQESGGEVDNVAAPILLVTLSSALWRPSKSSIWWIWATTSFPCA